MSNVYAIVDLAGYAAQMREAAAQNLCENYNDNLDEYISVDQMVGLVKSECLGFDDENRPLLDEDTNAEIFDKTSIWIHNVGLAKLAGQDLVECAWDNKSNEMIFWAKPTDTTKNAKTKSSNKKRNRKT